MKINVGAKLGAKTLNVIRFDSISLDKNAPICREDHPLKALERPIYSGRIGDFRGLQLSLISTT